MRYALPLASLSIAGGITWALTATALGAGQQAGPADPIPTAIEEAIIEHACGALHPAGAPESAAYLDCRQNQLVALRDDFGRDLRRLSNAERRAIDSACSGLRISQGQDAYVECLTGRLAPLRGRGSRAKPETAAVSALPSAEAPVVAPPPAPPSTSARWWIGSTILGLIVVASGGAFVAMRARRALGTCSSCGAQLVERGDLCQTCRHEAAEARRRATAERADQERVLEEEQRRQAAREDEQRQQLARDEEARRRQLEEAEHAQAQQEAEAQRARDAAEHQHQTDAVVTEEAFDPYVVLGLAADASAADVEAAYEAARSKYDLDLVADLGGELQQHFKTKRELVDRAYEVLTTRPAE